jgi:5-hydroxyisourate hydrolase-like protein (transthyretin family)
LKLALIAACCLLLAVIAASAAVEVENIKLQEASRNVRIAVVLEGKPVKGAKVEFCKTPGNQSCASVRTDADGIAAVRGLGGGNYSVIASIEDEINADLYLHVARGRKETSFSIDLTDSYQKAQEFLAAAEKLPIRDRVQEFRGSVQDPSGAFIQGVDIKITRKGSDGKTDVVRLKSDATGRFSTRLADGTYIAFFTFAGFRSQITPFEVTSQGSNDLRIVLELGSTT